MGPVGLVGRVGRKARLALPASLALLASVWLLLLLAAPIEAAGVTLSAAAYAFSSFICHQQVERSFHIGAAQIPVCARCFGLYSGAAIGAVVALLREPLWFAWRAMKARPTGYQRTLAVSALPTAATWSIEALGLAQPSNIVRAVAALPLGVAVAMLVVAAAAGRLR